MTIVGTRPEIIRLSRVIAVLDEVTDHAARPHRPELRLRAERDLLRGPRGAARRTTSSRRPARPRPRRSARRSSGSDEVLAEEKPDAVLILGDTNSCLAVIPAKRRKIPVFHMEAGNRCFDMRVPEEINRRIVDHVSDINLCYTEHGRRYLLAEGLAAGPGDQDRVADERGARLPSRVDRASKVHADGWSSKAGRYFTVSIHREENVDDPAASGEPGGGDRTRLAERYRVPAGLLDPSAHAQAAGGAGATGWTRWCGRLPPLGFFDYVRAAEAAPSARSRTAARSPRSRRSSGFPAVTVREAHERPEGMDEGAVVMSGLRQRTDPAGGGDDGGAVRRPWGGAGCRRTTMSTRFPGRWRRSSSSYTDYVNRRVWSKQKLNRDACDFWSSPTPFRRAVTATRSDRFIWRRVRSTPGWEVEVMDQLDRAVAGPAWRSLDHPKLRV